MNAIFGAGGFAREVDWLIADIAKSGGQRHSVGAFVASDDAVNIGTSIQGTRVIAETEFFEQFWNEALNIFVAVGSPKLKSLLVKKCIDALTNVAFPSLIHPSIEMDTRREAVRISKGSILCAGNILTTNIDIGEFVHLNLDCTIGHGAMIGAYSTISPGVHISGGVCMGEFCFVGTGAVLLENVVIPPNTAIGAGATVVKTITEPGTYVGTPAVRLQR